MKNVTSKEEIVVREFGFILPLFISIHPKVDEQSKIYFIVT